MSFPRIDSSRLILDKLTGTHAILLHEILSNTEAMRYWDTEPHKNIDETVSAIEKMHDIFLKEQGVSWGIFLKQSTILIGECGLHSWDRDSGAAQIGYIIHPRYWRNGYAAEALGLMIGYAFESLHLKRVIAETDPENKSSSTLLTRSGFSFNSRINNHFMINGRYHDSDVYSLEHNNG